MRRVRNAERAQRGCGECIDRVSGKCPHEECPYHELDDVKTYGEYLKRIPNVPMYLLLKGLEVG